MTSDRVKHFIDCYQRLNKHNLALLQRMYSEDIHFADPLHQVDGLASLTDYFANMYANVQNIEFDISSAYEVQDNAFLYWTMRFSHPKIKGGSEIAVQGHSKLEFSGDKVQRHRDYFDVGQMLYRQLPVLGTVIKALDKRMQSS